MKNFKYSYLLLFLCSIFLVKTSALHSPKITLDSIKENIMQLEYEFRPLQNSAYQFEAVNRAQNLRGYFKDNIFKITPRTGKNTFEVEYAIESISSPTRFNLSKNILKFSSNLIDIKYKNSKLGIRQDFIIKTPISKTRGQKDLVIKVKTPFDLKVAPDQVVHFEKNIARLSYSNLVVFDSDKKILKSFFKQVSKNSFAISFNDVNAKYPITIDPLSTTPNWNAEQNQASMTFGYSIAYVGDVNYDGYGDLLVGAPEYDGGQTDEGKIFLYYGSAAGINTTAAWSYENNQAGSQLGYAVENAGRSNNDNYSDFIASAPYYSNGQNEEGAVYYFKGTATTPAATPSAIIQGNVIDAHFGLSITGNAKFNNDTYMDIAVGAPHYKVSGAAPNLGAVYIFHGASGGLSTTVRATLTGEHAQAHFGTSVKAFGDVNNDTYTDLIVSSPYFTNGETEEGAIYLYQGSSTGLNTTLLWKGESNIPSMYYGETAAGGDINKDGKTDLIVGAPRYGTTYTSSGEVHIYYSNGTSFGATPNLILSGGADWDYFGGGLASGDINGDGHFEVIVGSTLHNGGLTEQGKVQIFYGTSFGLSTTPTWTKSGGSNYATLGQSIAVGDINGDKVNDLHISAAYESNGQSYEGKVYSFYGTPRGLNPIASSIFNVSQASSQFAFASSSAGDVNNDGHDDLIVGAYNYDNGQSNEGRVFLFLGSSSGLQTTPSWTYEINQASAQLGYAVTGDCDFNNDGYSDVVVGANLFDNGQSNEGKVYAFYGSGSGLPLSPSWQVESNKASAQFGKALACAKDTNGDGYDDLLIGAPNFTQTKSSEGKVFLYKGSSTGLATSPLWTFVSAQASANAGFAVSRAGDVNNDGHSDILIGTPLYDNGQTNEGKVFLFYGSATGPGATPNWTLESNKASAQLGYSLTYGKKLNNDNYDDFVIGAPYYTNTLTSEGAVYLYYGGSSGPNSTPVVAYGKQASANLGRTVQNAGDPDADGYNEIAVAAHMYDNGQTNEGAVYIFQGTNQGITNASVWKYEPNYANAYLGTSISGDFDINGDGYDDLVIGAPNRTVTNTSDGALYVFYGNPI